MAGAALNQHLQGAVRSLAARPSRGRSRTHVLRRLALAIGAVLMLGACQNACEPTPDGPTKPPLPTRVVIGTASEPRTLNPLLTTMASAHEIAALTSRQLTRYDAHWRIVPDLAVEVPTLKNGLVTLEPATGERVDGRSQPAQTGQGTAGRELSPEDRQQVGEPGENPMRMKVTWHIRPDAVWQDGTPVTADDFVFGWKLCLDKNQTTLKRTSCARVAAMKAEGPDKKTLVVTWHGTEAFFASYRVHIPLPKHVLEPALLKDDGTYSDMARHPSSKKPLSNGPYVLDTWTPGVSMVFKANPKAALKPRIAEVEYRFVPDTGTLLRMLQSGEVHASSPSAGLGVGVMDSVTQDRALRFVKVPGMVWAHVDFNLDDPLLKSAAVRQAIGMAINRDMLLDVVFDGHYQKATSFVPPRHWGYNAGLKPLAHDLAAAGALLDKAGLVLKNGHRVGPDGKPMVLELAGTAGNHDVERIQRAIVSDLSRVGIDVHVKNSPPRVFFGDVTRKRQFKHMAFFAWVTDPSYTGRSNWSAKEIPTAENGFTGSNITGWQNAEATRLLDEIEQSPDEKSRALLLRRVQTVWRDALPAVPLYYRPVTAVVNHTLLGFSPSGSLTPVTATAADWHFDTAAYAPTAPPAP